MNLLPFRVALGAAAACLALSSLPSCAAPSVQERELDRLPVKIGGGEGSFDFTKIANNGSALDAGATLGTNPSDWACTHDNVTGLVWEIKLNDSTSLRHRAHTYAWGNNPGANCNNTLGKCNTESYVHAVNAQALCGYSDWRLPTRRELQTLIDRNAPKDNALVEPAYFPNTERSYYWTGDTYAPLQSNAWNVYFGDGNPFAIVKTYNIYVRLVRGG